MVRFVLTRPKVIECTQNQKWPDTSYMNTCTPGGSNYHSFCCTINSFWVMYRFVQTRSKVIESLSAPRIKSGQTPHTSTTVPLEAQINALFALQSTVSELWSVLSKLGQRILSASTIKSGRTPHTHTTQPLEAQINSLFTLHQQFPSYGPFCPN